MKSRQGFTLLEVAIATTLLTVVLGASMRMIDSSAKASNVHRVRARAINVADETMDRLVLELSQTAGGNAGGLGAKYTLEPDGVRFQRVVGIGIAGGGFGDQIWSEEIRFHWDRDTELVTRQVGADEPTVIARGITGFSCSQNAEGQFVCTATCTRRAPSGELLVIERTLRATPLNLLD